MRLKLTRRLWIPESGICNFNDNSWKPTQSGCDHLCRSSSHLTSIYSKYQLHFFLMDQSTFGPVFLPGWSTACCFARLSEGIWGWWEYWFPFTLNLSGNSWLFFHFLSHCRGILPEKVDLINVSVIYLPPLKLLSCCRSSSYTVTLLWATPASKLPSTVIRSCGT